jgi:hypothetical protein
MNFLRGARVAGMLMVGALLAGCGPASLTAAGHDTMTHRPSASRPVVAPHTLHPRPVAGQATSVLQAGATAWVAMQTGHDVSIKPVAKMSRPYLILARNKLSCLAAGFLRRLGSNTVVTGCSDLWLFHDGHWVAKSLPSPLVTPGSVTAMGHRWWFLEYGTAASGNQNVTLWGSSNQGTAWARIASSSTSTPTPYRITHPHALPYYGDKTGIAAGPRGHLWLTGITMALGHTWLYHSSDGGRHWVSTQLPVPKTWTGAELTTYPPLFLGSHGTYLPVVVNAHTLAIYSRPGPSSPWRLAGKISGVGSDWDLATSSPRSLWVTSGNRLWFSPNGGKTWHDTWNTPPHWDLVSVSFSGPRDGVLLAIQSSDRSLALWVTQNGGKTWVPHQLR